MRMGTTPTGRNGSSPQTQRTTVAAILLTLAFAATACSAAKPEALKRDIACGVVDLTTARQALSTQELDASGTSEKFLKKGSWECEFFIPSSDQPGSSGQAARIELQLSKLQSWSQLVVDSPHTVSIGNDVDGAVSREWPPDDLGSKGYIYFPCREGRIDSDNKHVLLTYNDPGSVDGDVPSYRQLATVYVLAANAIRKAMSCEGDPYPLPDNLPDEPPTANALVDAGRACDTFDTRDISTMLPEASDPNVAWNVWQSPGDDFPSTACQLWRKRDISKDGEAETAREHHLLGPMVAFSRIAGAAADHFDLKQSRQYFDRVEPWDRFGGRGYSADNEMRLKRACGDEAHVYVGAYAPHTVTRVQYEKLFAQWVRTQSKRDGCPVT